ncbi:dihydrofolate reductase family protein [Arthrobacter sp. Cr_A7]|uniref:dihydrofolate reductase family protein n=1 Tax=Arthrobacter sp. Cr_A7 TaxID=3031017 RepID=UPI0023DCCA55|nr:dihydrofolate reductase family protein [Arthrobacter sp. Cr_A7]MDF2050842.1 dihydrofolate reductase family protein [Arthrobacter sp. Cr_A7]
MKTDSIGSGASSTGWKLFGLTQSRLRPAPVPIAGESEQEMDLKVTMNVTVDGVMQGLGGPDEDRRGGFERGGWAGPLLDPESRDYLNEVYGNAAAFLFGKWTYEVFAGSWGSGMADATEDPVAAALNNRPKYVVSTTLSQPAWEPTTVLTGDIASHIRKLKEEGEGDLVVPGSLSLVRWLLANDFVDQIDLTVYPVVVGQGNRLFPESGPDYKLELLESSTTSRGLVIQKYRPAGRPEYGVAAESWTET